MAVLFTGPLTSGWGKRLTGIHRMGHPMNLIIRIFLRSSFCEHWHGTQISGNPLSIQRGLSMDHFVTKFSSYVPSKSLTMQPNYWLITMYCYRLVLLASLLMSKINNQMYWLILATGRISLHHCPSGLPQNGAKALQLLSGAWISCKIIHKPGPSFLFLSQLAMGNSSWGPRYRLEERR